MLPPGARYACNILRTDGRICLPPHIPPCVPEQPREISNAASHRPRVQPTCFAPGTLLQSPALPASVNPRGPDCDDGIRFDIKGVAPPYRVGRHLSIVFHLFGPSCSIPLRLFNIPALDRQSQLSLQQQSAGLPQFVPVNPAEDARYVAMASIRARPVSGIAKQPHAIIQNHVSGRCRRQGMRYHLKTESLLTASRSVEKISQTLQQYRAILQKLFPSVHPEQLQGLSRERLIDLISKTNPFQAPSPITPCSDRPPSIHPDAGSLEQLQPLPEDTVDTFETQRQHKALPDHANALPLSMKHSSSYLGISSVMAALRVILWLDPECQTFVNKCPNRPPLVSRSTSVPQDTSLKATFTASNTETQGSTAWDENGVPVINAYFHYVHPFVPLIDEDSFRDTYMTKQRNDSRWTLLLNAVLAMGSMANGKSENGIHSVFFDRAKEYLNVDTLGSAHVETVQALALSAFYLHYTQESNLANALMGAALRMATALGLHRDYTEGLGPTNTSKAHFSIEMRRRVWWSIFMFDTWASATLGRPSMGRWSHAITTRSPQEPIVSRSFSKH